MRIPLQITYRDVPPLDETEAIIQEHVGKLEALHERIISCRVAIEAPHRQHRKGNHYRVRIDLTVPGDELVVDRESEDGRHEDLQVALNDAFRHAHRKLQDFATRRRGEVKTHDVNLGKIIKLFRVSGYGFLEASDGREIYFHKNSVLGGGFEKLEIGNIVRFDEEMGDKGPQASTVEVVQRAAHHGTDKQPVGVRVRGAVT